MTIWFAVWRDADHALREITGASPIDEPQNGEPVKGEQEKIRNTWLEWYKAQPEKTRQPGTPVPAGPASGQPDKNPPPPPGPPGGGPAQVVVNSQKSLVDAVGDGFQNQAWESPTELLPREFPGLASISGPNDQGLGPKVGWRKPVVLNDKASGVEVSINCYRLRGKDAATGIPGTPSAPLLETDYRYKPAAFHKLRAAAAAEGDREVFAFRDGDLLFKVEATGGKPEARRSSTSAVAEVIWKFRHPE